VSIPFDALGGRELEGGLLNAYERGLIEFQAAPPRFTASTDGRPVASPLARATRPSTPSSVKHKDPMMTMASTPFLAKPPAQACRANPARKHTPSPRARVTRSAMRMLLVREYRASNAASSRKQNAAVEADNQLSHHPTNAAPSSTGPQAASNQ